MNQARCFGNESPTLNPNWVPKTKLKFSISTLKLSIQDKLKFEQNCGEKTWFWYEFCHFDVIWIFSSTLPDGEISRLRPRHPTRLSPTTIHRQHHVLKLTLIYLKHFEFRSKIFDFGAKSVEKQSKIGIEAPENFLWSFFFFYVPSASACIRTILRHVVKIT